MTEPANSENMYEPLNSAKPVRKFKPVPAVYERLANTRRSTTGCGVSSSCTMKLTSAMAATAESVTIKRLSSQPSRLPSSSTYCKEAMPTPKSVMPSTSTLAAAPLGALKPGSSMKRSAKSAAMQPSGTLTMKIQCQLNQSIK